MTTSAFFPSEESKQHIPPTEITEDRGVVQGSVHDESTHYFQSGGVSSGASGLFATAKDIAKFVSGSLSFAPDKLLFFSKEMARNFTTNQFPLLLPTITP